MRRWPFFIIGVMHFVYMKRNPFTYKYFWLLLMEIAVATVVFFFRGRSETGNSQQADLYNTQSYSLRYKDLQASSLAALQAFKQSAGDPIRRAEALNNMAFCAFMQMDFERSAQLLRQVYGTSSSELEALVADVGMMRLCQRTSMNKEFYDYRNSALKRIKRINAERASITSPRHIRRINYAISDFYIVSSVYYYYLQQDSLSVDAINSIHPDETLQSDTAQWINYYYMKGSGGLYTGKTSEEVLLGEFSYLMECLEASQEYGYLYFEANALQALAELLMRPQNVEVLQKKRSGLMRMVNPENLPSDSLARAYAFTALQLFKDYGDIYQISGSYRTLASCYNEVGQYELALYYLDMALEYVNKHHEKYYHCTDSLDRLQPYVPNSLTSVELQWIRDDGIKTIPEWIARIREQLSVTYAALGRKPESDYNRNIYLDILDYTRQDKQLESRFMALKKESAQMNALLALIIVGIVLFIGIFVYLSHRWRTRNTIYLSKLRETIELCRKITATVPEDAACQADVARAVMKEVRADFMRLAEARWADIVVSDADGESEKGEETDLPDLSRCRLYRYPLLSPADGSPLGELRLYRRYDWEKELEALMRMVVPFVVWTLENGLTMLQLGDECRRLEKEQYIHDQHLAANKRQNVVRKACFAVVQGMLPYIDRIRNEIEKLRTEDYAQADDVRRYKYTYIEELVNQINDYNDILARWVKMRQGTLSLSVENFALDELFRMVVRSRQAFELKGLTLQVGSTDAVVKADKALTFFMLNTLADNARKYTHPGGRIELSAVQQDNYVEISVTDTGIGMSQQDVDRILSEKVYDSAAIGATASGDDARLLQQRKGSGFGLMNCKGIIDKYRKTNRLFEVCRFGIESTPGKGSRFYFRLPKGTAGRLMLFFSVCMMLFPSCNNASKHASRPADSLVTQLRMVEEDFSVSDSILSKANDYANAVYNCNVNGFYRDALFYADSAFSCMNDYYCIYSTRRYPLLKLNGKGEAAELKWLAQGFYTDYYILLDVRNEAAVAYLALKDLDAYNYNNTAYVTLYKQLTEDTSLSEYCLQMQHSSNNKSIAIMLCVLLLFLFLISYYLFYLRNRLRYRYNMEQVLAVNQKVFATGMFSADGQLQLQPLIECLFTEMKELLPLKGVGLALYDKDASGLTYVFHAPAETREKACDCMRFCFEKNTREWLYAGGWKCMPLWVESEGDNRCMGVLALLCGQEKDRTETSLLIELVGGYLSAILYNSAVRMEDRLRDIELAKDEASRSQREENQLHVQNMVLDNCLSTIKHETVYYPNKIKQIIDKLNRHEYTPAEEREQIRTMSELVSYYKDVFSLLSSCAARQLDEITFRRTAVRSTDLAAYARTFLSRLLKKKSYTLQLEEDVADLQMTGDTLLLHILLENLLSEAVAYPASGVLRLQMRPEGEFVRITFTDTRRNMSASSLNTLFYPDKDRMQEASDGQLQGTEYLICRQIIREHDAYAGRRGCRINAEAVPDGGFSVWFTIPLRK